MFHKPTKEELKKDYIDNKLSTLNMGKKYNCSHATIRRWLIKHDIKIRNISESLRGKKLSIKHKNNLSISLSGYKHPNFGKKMSEEQKKKISKTKKENPYRWSREDREKMSKTRSGALNSMFGKTHSKEAKEKMRIKKLEMLKNIGHSVIGKKQEEHHNWQGGLTPLQKSLRKIKKYKIWRKTCFVRDNFTCIFCGAKGKKLNVDHIQPFSYIIKKYNIKTLSDGIKCKDLWAIENGRTLCVKCHKKTTTYGYLAKHYFNHNK